ncbi:HEPN domain-containing protein [Pseudomonas chlororaphis]
MAVEGKKISAAKVAYETLLEQNAEWQCWIAGAVEFESALKPHVPWNDLDGWQRQVVGKRLAITAPDPQLLANSFYVTMVAGFEEYLRTVIREVVFSLNAARKKASEVSAAMVKCHVKEAAGLLKRVDSPPDYISINVEDLCRSIGSCVPGSTLVEFSVEALAHIESPIKMDNFFTRMTELGFAMSWDVLGGGTELKEALSLPNKTGSRDVGKVAKSEVERVARYRNRIAHTGGHAADVSPQVMTEDAEILRALCSGVDAIVYPKKKAP